MVVLDGSLADIDPLEVERLRRIVLAYKGDKALLELNDGELLKALGFTREQNGVVYPTIAGILMVGRVPSIKKHIPTGISSFQVLEGKRTIGKGNAEHNAAFDRCIDVMSKMILKYGNKVLENKTLGELLKEEQKAA